MANEPLRAQNPRINENKVRLNALWVFILVTFSIFYAGLPIVLFLAVDFFLRGFGYGKYSPLANLSDVVIKQLNIPNKPIFQAPKRFAARIGFVLSVLIVVSLLLQLGTIALLLSIVFAIFAFLESFVGFCAGCYVYSFLLQLKMIKQ
jgi:hypothetical protein